MRVLRPVAALLLFLAGLAASTDALAAEAPEAPLVLRPELRGSGFPVRPAALTGPASTPTRTRLARGRFTAWNPNLAHVTVHGGAVLVITGAVMTFADPYNLLPAGVLTAGAGGLVMTLPYWPRTELVVMGTAGMALAGTSVWLFDRANHLPGLDGFGELIVGIALAVGAGGAVVAQAIVSEAHLPWRIEPVVGADQVGLRIRGTF